MSELKPMLRIKLRYLNIVAETIGVYHDHIECPHHISIVELLQSIADKYGPKVKKFFFGDPPEGLNKLIQVAIVEEGRVGSRRIDFYPDRLHTKLQSDWEVIIFVGASGG